jgi:hypothetical protein
LRNVEPKYINYILYYIYQGIDQLPYQIKLVMKEKKNT